jgi:hypothetical protein
MNHFDGFGVIATNLARLLIKKAVDHGPAKTRRPGIVLKR